MFEIGSLTPFSREKKRRKQKGGRSTFLAGENVSRVRIPGNCRTKQAPTGPLDRFLNGLVSVSETGLESVSSNFFPVSYVS